MTQLNLTHDDLVRLLHSLSCAKYKILSKEPNTKTILPTDNFEFNSKFTDRMRRIKVFSAFSLFNCFYHSSTSFGSFILKVITFENFQL